MSRSPSKSRAALICLGLALFLAQPGGQARGLFEDGEHGRGDDGRRHGDDDDHDRDALPFSMGYLITGNYVVGGVSLKPKSPTRGFATGTIPMAPLAFRTCSWNDCDAVAWPSLTINSIW